MFGSKGLAHRVMEDDIYDGMLIPKGSTIVINTRFVVDKDKLSLLCVIESCPIVAWPWTNTCIDPQRLSIQNGTYRNQKVTTNPSWEARSVMVVGWFPVRAMYSTSLSKRCTGFARDAIWRKLACGLLSPLFSRLSRYPQAKMKMVL